MKKNYFTIFGDYIYMLHFSQQRRYKYKMQVKVYSYTLRVFGGKEGRKRDERDFTDWLGGETNLFFIPL